MPYLTCFLRKRGGWEWEGWYTVQECNHEVTKLMELSHFEKKRWKILELYQFSLKKILSMYYVLVQILACFFFFFISIQKCIQFQELQGITHTTRLVLGITLCRYFYVPPPKGRGTYCFLCEIELIMKERSITLGSDSYYICVCNTVP